MFFFSFSRTRCVNVVFKFLAVSSRIVFLCSRFIIFCCNENVLFETSTFKIFRSLCVNISLESSINSLVLLTMGESGGKETLGEVLWSTLRMPLYVHLGLLRIYGERRRYRWWSGCASSFPGTISLSGFFWVTTIWSTIPSSSLYMYSSLARTSAFESWFEFAAPFEPYSSSVICSP